MDDLITREQNYTISGQVSEAAELCKAEKWMDFMTKYGTLKTDSTDI